MTNKEKRIKAEILKLFEDLRVETLTDVGVVGIRAFKIEFAVRNRPERRRVYKLMQALINKYPDECFDFIVGAQK